ncbi:hypothetical protein BGZ95_006943 [Linnemannia exigua]|uniref:Uncharacterized protein n=1 Tax=Linnemannia exigua TaxID=604196 RepID=A0AAD4DFL7_9FUNG|nr:hypothetical protein BGZ95_006943 [Linnemannia exigua]
MDTLNGSLPPKPKSAAFRNLQPRAAAALDFNDDSDDEDFGLLSADYKAQRKTTLDLVDFFKNAPPPPPPPALPPVTVDDKKKRSLLQRLRNRRSNGGLNGGGAGNRASFLGLSSSGSGFGAGGSNVSAAGTMSTTTGTSATLPNGKKYVMIAVDYKDTSSATSPTSPGSSMSQISPVTGITGALATTTSAGNNNNIRSSPNSSRRHSRYDDVTATGSSLLGSNVHFTTPFENKTYTTSNNGYSHPTTANNTAMSSTLVGSSGGDQRRSIIIQAGGGEGSTFLLDNSPFLLDSFALDTDFIMPSNLGAQDSKVGTDGGLHQHQQQQHRRTQSQRSGHSQTLDGSGSRRGANKVTFNIAGQQNIVSAAEEDAVSKALSQRIANHKAQLLKNQGLLSSATDDESANESGQETKPPEVTLPRPISRKKVRHVQIQTQHCIMRPMFTQTEPIESLVRDSEVKEFSTQTMEGTCEMGTSTELDAVETASVATSTATTVVNVSTPPGGSFARGTSSKVASLVASLSQPPTPTTGFPTSMFPKGSTATTAMSTTSTDTLVQPHTPSSSLSSQEQEELVLLRQKNAALQAQVQTLQRDLSSEMRARTRTAVAMQDTRDKFEMLSAIAFKKIKEMIFQRHVLEMEVRELRAQVDMHNAEDAAVSAAGTVVSGGSGSGSGSVGSGRSSRSGHRHQQHHQQQQHHHLQQKHQHHQQQYVSVGHY